MTEQDTKNPDNELLPASAAGSKITDDQGREFIDYDCRCGSVILGHANEQVVTAVTKAARRGLGTMGDSHLRGKFSSLMLGCFKSFNSAVFFESGLSALKASVATARRNTGRSRIISCGCGPIENAEQGIFNDLGSISQAIKSSDTPVAAVYVAPVRTCNGVIRPGEGFLGGVRKLCNDAGASLIFDERVTGFRLAFGGAQDIFDIEPDMTVLGGVIGGGLPMGAVLGNDLNTKVENTRLLPANQLAMACGLATLEPLRDGAIYGRLEALGASLNDGLTKTFAAAKCPATVMRSGSMMTVRFAEQEDVNRQLYGQFRNAMIEEGVLPPADAGRPWFLCAAHDEKDVKATIMAAAAVADKFA